MSAVQRFGLSSAIQNTTNPSSVTEIEGADGAEDPHHDVGNEEEADYDSIDSDEESDKENEDENDDTANLTQIFGQQGNSNGNGGAVMRNADGRFVAKHQKVDMAAVLKQPSKLADDLQRLAEGRQRAPSYEKQRATVSASWTAFAMGPLGFTEEQVWAWPRDITAGGLSIVLRIE
ncbi:hypothetical protein HDU89_007770 [Geranomyces variabilis]|nr:hypothetical protein HDU89_007770 [Geranomyces variabilis]